MFQLFNIFLITLASALAITQNELQLSEATLKLIFATVRNGEHYPDLYALRYDTRFDKIVFPPGELIQDGKKTMYDVGQTLRKRYGNYLGSSAHTIFFVKIAGVVNQENNSNRTIESALILQEGLKEAEEKYALNRNWTDRQRISVQDSDYTERASQYYLKCKKYPEEQNKILQRDLREKIQNRYKNIIKILREKTNLPLEVNKLSNLHTLYELYKDEMISKIQKPNWLTDEIFSQFTDLMNDYIAASFGTNALKSMTAGLHVKHFFHTINLLKGNKLQPCNTRMFLFAGNGATVAPLFAAFGGEKGYQKLSDKSHIKSFYPNHGGMTIIEVHKVKTKYYVKIFYSQDSKSELTEVVPIDCGYPCEVNKYRRVLNDIHITKKELEVLCDSLDSKSLSLKN